MSSLWLSKREPLIFLAVLLASLLPSLLRIAWPFLTSFILASILAIVINPVNQWLSRRVHRLGLATFFTTFATVFLLGIIVAFAGLALAQELTTTYEGLSRRSLEEGGWPALVTHTADRVVGALATRIPLNAAAIREELLDGMRTVTGYLRNNAGAAIGDMTSVLITGLLTTIFLYFLLRHGEDWIGRLAALTPLDPRVSASLFRTVHDSVVANVNGVLAVAFGQGLLLSLGFWFVGVRSPVLWGTIGGLASIIPVVGSPLVWVPIVIAFIFMGAYWKALLLCIWCVIVIGSVDNVLRPFVVGARDKQHPMLIALAAIGGTYAFGILGILLGPLVLSLVAALLKEIQALVLPREMIETEELRQVDGIDRGAYI
jgi:predicted PurR-regulated permease PerM